MDTIDPDDPLMDEYLEDEFVESISDEYDEESLNDEGFHIEGVDQDEDSFSSTNGFDLDDYDD